MTLKNGDDVPALDALRASKERIAGEAAKLEAELRQAVRDARKAGASWQDVGDAMDMSRQAAWERFAEPEPKQAKPANERSTKERRRMVRDETDEDNVVVRIVGRRPAAEVVPKRLGR